MFNFLKSFTYSFVALMVALMIVPGAQQLPTEEVFLYWLLASVVSAWALPRLATVAANMRPLPGDHGPVAEPVEAQSFDFDDEDIQFVEVTQ